MRALVCKTCKKELTNKMEVEYSEWFCEFFCCSNCATQYYYEQAGSISIDLTDKGILKDHVITIKNRYLMIPG